MQIFALGCAIAGIAGLARLLAILDEPGRKSLGGGRVRWLAPDDVTEMSSAMARIAAMYRDYRSPRARINGRRLLDVAANAQWDIESIATDDCATLGRHTFIRFNNGRVFRLSGAEAASEGDIGTLTRFPEELLAAVPLMHAAAVFDEESGVSIAFDGPLGRVMVHADAAVALR